jgi:hypothetical protein
MGKMWLTYFLYWMTVLGFKSRSPRAVCRTGRQADSSHTNNRTHIWNTWQSLEFRGFLTVQKTGAYRSDLDLALFWTRNVKPGLRQTPRVMCLSPDFGSIPSDSNLIHLMTGPKIPIGHIDWVKVIMYDLQDFCPTYEWVYIVQHNVSHST